MGKEATSQNIKGTFSRKLAFLTSQDKSFKIEAKYFETCMGQKGVERVQALVLGFLPRDNATPTVQESLSKFQAQESSAFLDFAGFASIANGSPPSMPLTSN
eukprot:14750382-Alexandrium_andersonii.AAC.1